MSRITFIGQSAHYRQRQLGDLRLVNGYAEVIESKQGKTVVALRGTPGLKVWTTAPGTGAMRGLYLASNGVLYLVRGNTFSEVDPVGNVLTRGTLLTTEGPVQMTDNRIDVMLVDGQYGYALTLATQTFTQLVSPAFSGSTHISFLDGYFVYPILGSQQFGWSDLLSTTFDPLNFSTVDGAPDNLVAQLVAHRELWQFGVWTTELWYSSGDADAPFARMQGGFLHHGCAAPHSPARVGEAVYWLSTNEQGHAMVLQAQGVTPQRISTHPVEEALHGYAVVRDALGWGQQQGGHLWYFLTFPTANATWVYDVTTGLWHERGALDPAHGTIGRHRAQVYAFAYGKHLVADYEDGRVYELDPLTYADDDLPLIFEASLPPLFDEQGGARVRHDRLHLDCAVGVGRDGGLEPGVDPQVLLRISNDGGATYPVERTASLGPLGETRTQVEWRQLGAGYARTYKLRISDPVERTIMGAWADVQVLGA